MDSDRQKEMLTPKVMGMRKPSKKVCTFLIPSRMTKEGRMILTKRCTAYIPNCEVKEEREICELCSVPDLFVKDDRCVFFAPLEVTLELPTTWRCAKSRKKNIDPGQCNEKYCPDYEKAEKNRWDIGRLGRPQEGEAPVSDEKGGPSLKRAEPLSQKSLLIPKSMAGKKRIQKDAEES